MTKDPWPIGGGKTGEWIRARDWSNTPFGPVATWPPCLKTAVDICLASPIPVSVLWGKQHLQIYNDLYADTVVGIKHPRIFGEPGLPNACVDPDLLRPIYDRIFADGTPTLWQDFPVSLHLEGGIGEHFFTCSFSAIRDESGNVAGILQHLTETTSTHRTQAERYRALVTASSEVLYRMNADWSEMRQLQGGSFLSDTEKPSHGWLQRYILPDDQTRVIEAIEEAVRTRSTFELEHRVQAADGTIGWSLSRAVPLLDDHGAIIEWFGAASDITARKNAEIALRESEERFRVLVDGAHDFAMLLLDAQGRITFWSMGGERIFGWRADEVIGRVSDFLFPSEEQERGIPAREREQARQHGHVLDLRWHLRKDGTQFWADGMLMRLENADGTLRGFARVARDATEQKRAEEAVVRANEALEERVRERTQTLEERTEELARMSEMRQELLRKVVTAQEEERARISRDLHDDTGQQITALLLGLSHLESTAAIAADPEAQETLKRLQMYAGEVAKKSHRLSFTLRPTALDDIGLMGALENYVHEWSHWSGIPVELESFSWEVAPGHKERNVRLPPEIETTIYRVTQEALTNVLRHAGPGVSPHGEAASRVSIVVQRTAGTVITTIEDDGPGFDVEEALSLPPGKRRLGIFGMQERARLAGGTLMVESAPGTGTTVYLRLPLPNYNANE